jgi:hypothetical protein
MVTCIRTCRSISSYVKALHDKRLAPFCWSQKDSYARSVIWIHQRDRYQNSTLKVLPPAAESPAGALDQSTSPMFLCSANNRTQATAAEADSA